MAEFQLQENDSISNIRSLRPKKVKKSFAARMVGWGLAPNENQARLYLIVFVVIGFVLIIYMNIKTFAPPPDIPLEDEMLI